MSSLSSVVRRGDLPHSALMMYRSALPATLASKTICRPSGDQRGHHNQRYGKCNEDSFFVILSLTAQQLRRRLFLLIIRRCCALLSAFFLHLAHLSHKAIAALRHGLDITLAIPLFTERLADERDV